MWRVYHAKEMLVLILRHGTSYITKHTKSMIIQKKKPQWTTLKLKLLYQKR